MANLITHHDPYHVHKTLGLLSLLQYVYRYACMFRYGTMFPANEPLAWTTVGVLLPLALSLTSLLLPLPRVRNFNRPMIWPENRLHSIVFGARHVIGTLMSLYGLWPDDQNVLANAVARAALILGTVHAASIITDKYGDPTRKIRTINAMVLPDFVSEAQGATIKLFYVRAQFTATAACFFDDPTIHFSPLYAIQISPLMMTLVRKGKAKTQAFHIMYSIGLFLGVLVMLGRLSPLADDPLPKSTRLKIAIILFFPSARMRLLGLSAKAVWTFNVVLSTIIYPLFVQDWLDNMVSEEMATSLFKIMTISGVTRLAVAFGPLLGLSSYLLGTTPKSERKIL